MKKYIQLIFGIIITVGFSVFSMDNNQLIKEKWKRDFYRIQTLKIQENGFDEKPSDIEFDNTGNYILFTVKNSQEKSIIGAYSFVKGTCIFESKKIKNLDLKFQLPFKAKNNTSVEKVDYFIESEHDMLVKMKWIWFNDNNISMNASSSSESFCSKISQSFANNNIVFPENNRISKSSKHFIECGDSTIVEDYKNALVVRDVESDKTKYLALLAVKGIQFLCKIMKYSQSLLVAMSNYGDIICAYDTDKNELTFFWVLLKKSGFAIDEQQNKAFGNIHFDFSE